MFFYRFVLKAVLGVVFGIGIAQASRALEESTCEALLGTQWTPELVNEFRSYVIDESLKYGAQFPQHNVSLFRGTEHSILPVTNANNGHALYIGSGADVYRSLVDFPTAEHHHLLDKMTAWGASPLFMLLSIKHRLEQMGLVRIKSLGFLERRSLSDFQIFTQTPSETALNNFKTGRQPERPLILELSLTLPKSQRKVKKLIWIHEFDYAVHNDFEKLFEGLNANEPLLGVLIAGLSGTPHAADMNALLDRLTPDGYFVMESDEREVTDGFLTEWLRPISVIEDVRSEFSKFLGVPPLSLGINVARVYHFETPKANLWFPVMIKKNK